MSLRLVIVVALSGSGRMPNGIDFFRRFAFGCCLALPWLAGCAAFHPMNGVPARYIPDDMKIGRRNGQRTIDLSLLSQKPHLVHLVDSGDVLGIYIGGVLGKIDENPQVQIPQNSDYQPAAGVPVTVREDGTISLPMIKALSVRGLTTRETEEAIRLAYTNHDAGKEFLRPERERILVSLQRPRQTHVMVVRQDSRNEPVANAAVGLLNLGTTKRGTGKVVALPAYRNDVLNALIATDGLPGLDAENAVYIIRRQPNLADPASVCPPPADPAALIRQSKAADATVIRGQNPDGWDYRTQVPNATSNQFADPNGNYRQSAQYNPSPPLQNRMNVQGWGDQFQKAELGQAAFQAQGADDRIQSSQQQFQGNTSPPDVAPTGYQSPQPWGIANGISQQWNNSNPQPNPYAPTPLANPNQQPGNSAPSAGTPPQLATPNMAAQPNWVPPTPNGTSTYGAPAPYGVPAVPGPGYSLPDAQSQGQDRRDLNGSQGQPLDYDPQINFDGTDIGLADGRRIVRIPIRLGPDEHVDIKEEDVILHEGDIVFIESRDTEVFFTGGLLGGGQYTLPRDFDLDILQALSIATSRLNAAGAARQIGGVSALNSDVTISPSNVVVIRKLPEGGEVPIKINLYQARSDLSERIIIQPGDYIYLQYTKCEAIAAFIERHLLEGALFGLFSQSLTTTH